MRNGVTLAGIVFVVALATVVGNRLSNEAMAVVVGTVCGISASIPVTIGLIIASSRNWGREESPREISYDYGGHRYAPQPPVVVISPPPQAQSPYGFPQGQYCLPSRVPEMGMPREFKIIGEE